MEAIPQEFKLKDIVVVCRSCGLAFATSALVEIPPISDLDQVEADLHRVLPDPAYRAALIAVCPDCHFASWTSTFRRVGLKVEVVMRSECPASQKFALAVKSGREANMHPLDLAFIALNGCWAAREAGEPDDLWLELAAFEHARGLADNPLSCEEDGLGHLMMAEIWRQLKQFDRAVRHYELALKDDTVPKELIVRQRMLAKNGHSAPSMLPAAMVRQVFMSVNSPDVVFEEVEELTVPPMPARKPHEKLAEALGVTPPAAAAVQTAGSISMSSPSTGAAAGTSLQPVPQAVPADRSAFVHESFPHTGNGTAGASDDHDIYSDVMPAGKEQVVLPEAPKGPAAHNRVDARLHSHYFRRASSPAKEEEPAGDDTWITDFDRKPVAAAPAIAAGEITSQQQVTSQPESYESDLWEQHAAAAAANNAQALMSEQEAFEAYQNQAIDRYVAAQSTVAPQAVPAQAAQAVPAQHAVHTAQMQSARSIPPVPEVAALPPVTAEAVERVLKDVVPLDDDDDEFDDEFDEDDIPIEAIIPAITLTGDVNAAPLKKKKRRRQRYAVSTPQALAPAVNYGGPAHPTQHSSAAQPVAQTNYAAAAAQSNYPAPMPQANYVMAGHSTESYEPPTAAIQQATQAPQPMDTDESGGPAMDVSDAVARVESYLALSQQARRINWLRGYRGN